MKMKRITLLKITRQTEVPDELLSIENSLCINEKLKKKVLQLEKIIKYYHTLIKPSI